MLCGVPGVGLLRAKIIARTYSSPKKLLDAYKNILLSVDDKSTLIYRTLQDSISKKTAIDMKISKRIYEIFTCLDGKISFDHDRLIIWELGNIFFDLSDRYKIYTWENVLVLIIDGIKTDLRSIHQNGFMKYLHA